MLALKQYIFDCESGPETFKFIPCSDIVHIV